jgi:hypothetical protein
MRILNATWYKVPPLLPGFPAARNQFPGFGLGTPFKEEVPNFSSFLLAPAPCLCYYNSLITFYD